MPLTPSRGTAQSPTWNAGKDLADSNEQVLGNLPPDGKWGSKVLILPNTLRDGLVVGHVPQSLCFQDTCQEKVGESM